MPKGKTKKEDLEEAEIEIKEELVNNFQGLRSESSIIDEARDIEDVFEETPIAVNEPIKKIEPLYGSIFGCGKLRIRSNPNVKSQIIGYFNSDSSIKIIKEESTETFYCVETNGKKGFCMKAFVKLIY